MEEGKWLARTGFPAIDDVEDQRQLRRLTVSYQPLLPHTFSACMWAPVDVDTNLVAREEAYLERKFGDVYCSYRARVRRWL